MENKEILQKSIEKAINNGFIYTQASFDFIMNMLRSKDATCKSAIDYYINENKYFDLIYNHDFARTFWGEETICCECQSKTNECEYHLLEPHTTSWKYYLKQMVLEKEPLKYLERFL